MTSFTYLDRRAKAGAVRDLLAFRPDLPSGHYQTFVVLVTYVTKDGVTITEPLRAANGNIREYRSAANIEKLAYRWNVPGIFFAIFPSSTKQYRVQHLSAKDWKHILNATRVKYEESSCAF